MSRTIKKNVIFLCFIIAFTGCNVKKTASMKDIHQKHEQENQDNNIYDNTKFGIIENENDSVINSKVDELSQNIVNKSQQKELEKDLTSSKDPINIVDSLLKHPSRNLNIAIVAPVTGKYSRIGETVFESSFLNINDKRRNNINIRIYDIGKLTSNNWKYNPEVQRLLKDDNDVIIGAFFTDTAKKLLSIVPNDKLFISFINNVILAKDYPNLIVVDVNDRTKIESLLQYFQDVQRNFVSLILPATRKGYETEKLFRKLVDDDKTKILNVQFYQKNSRASILSAVRGINKIFKVTFLIKDGKLVTEFYKDNLARKKEEKLQQDLLSVKETKTVSTNAIYIEADERDLITILNGLDTLGILGKDVQIFSNAIISPENSISTKLDNVYYIGYNYDFVSSYNDKFNFYFQHYPNNFAYITHDIISVLSYLLDRDKALPRKFYTEDGFRGVLDEFRFTRDGNIERRFGLYKLSNKRMFRVYVPTDYLSSNELNDNSIYSNNDNNGNNNNDNNLLDGKIQN